MTYETHLSIAHALLKAGVESVYLKTVQTKKDDDRNVTLWNEGGRWTEISIEDSRGLYAYTRDAEVTPIEMQQFQANIEIIVFERNSQHISSNLTTLIVNELQKCMEINSININSANVIANEIGALAVKPNDYAIAIEVCTAINIYDPSGRCEIVCEVHDYKIC